MKKRLLSLVLCLVMVFSLLPFSGFATPEEDGYEEATPADGRVWRASDDYEDLYAYVDRDGDGTKEYVLVKPDPKNFYTAIDKPEGWTAQSAFEAKQANTSREYPDLYWTADNNSYEKVEATAEQYYKNAGEVPAENLCGSGFWSDWFTHYGVTTPVTYYYTPENVSVEYPSWHRVYSNLTGVTGYKIGHYIDLWYYTHSEEGTEVDDSGSSYTTQKNLGNVARIPKSRTEGGWTGHGDYEAYLNNGTAINKPTDNYNGGDLYRRMENTSGTLNNLKTETGHILAWPLTASADDPDSYVPGSSTNTTDTLYYRDPGAKMLVYADAPTQQLTGSQTAAKYTDQLYNGKLYYKLENNTRYIVRDPKGATIPYDDGSVVTNPDAASDETGSVKLNKTLTQAAKDNYTLTLEGYAVVGGTTTKKIIKTPTDFVVVVDESGSMKDTDIPTSYVPVSGQKTLEQVAEGNYYVNVNGEYYRVFAKRGYLFEKFPKNTLWTEDIVKDSEKGLRWFQGNEEQKFSMANQYYLHEDSGAFRPVTVEVEGKIGTYYVQFFTYPGGDTTANKDYFNRGTKPWYHSVTGGTITDKSFGYGAINSAVKTLYPRERAYTYSTFVGVRTGMFINYDMYKRHVGYTGLYYRDVNGNEWPVQITGSSLQTDTEYCNSKGYAVTTDGGSARMNYAGLYQAGSTMRRIDALKAALNQFASAVAGDTDDTGYVDNRVAVIGFASEARDLTTGLQPAGDGNGAVSNALSTAISNIRADGGTQPEKGFNLAKTILESRTGDDAKRNTVIIFFTDGRPGDHDYVNQYVEANDAVEAAYNLKTLNCGTADEPKYPTIYSIGVFGESDGNPLLEPRDVNNNDLRSPKAVEKNDDYEYEGGFMEKIYKQGSWNDYYYMRRQWRPDNANYTEEPNDTIFDYMSVVSSNYPNAHTFIKESWLANNYDGTYVQATEAADVRSTDTAIKDSNNKLKNDYYRMASTQATLVAAFEEAITKTVESYVDNETTSVLDTNAEIRDKINIDAFDVSEATYSVKKVPVYADVEAPVSEGGYNTYYWTVKEDTTRQNQTVVIVPEGTHVPASGVISANGLDYASEYVNRRHAGFKLVVEIKGLKPLEYNTDIKSNSGDACIYPSGDTTPMVSIESPVVNVHKEPVNITWQYDAETPIKTDTVEYGAMPVYSGDTPYKAEDANFTYVFTGWTPEIVPAYQDAVYTAVFDAKQIESETVVVDFNAPMILAEESGKDLIKDIAGTNGKFDVNNNDEAYYQLDSDVLNGDNTSITNALDLTAYSSSDFARVFGRHIDLTTGAVDEEATWKRVTVVPATNIYFSDHTKQTAVKANNQIGYNEGIVPDSALDLSDEGIVSGKYFYQFKGTRIDVYAGTANNSGTILGTLYDAENTSKPVKMKSMMMATAAENQAVRFNAPVLSFSEQDGIVAGKTYILKITSTDTAKFRLDGIRVYNGATNDLEQNAKYINLRDVILKESDALKLDAEHLVEGVTFYTDAEAVGLTDPDMDPTWGSTTADDNVKKYIPQDYKHIGPKNEVYLATGDAIGFEVPEGLTAMVSMRAPETGSATVAINGTPFTLNSAVDMYYPVEPKDGIVLISNISGKVQNMVFDENGDPLYDENHQIVFEDTDQDTLVSIVNVKLTGEKVNGRSALYSSAKLNRFASRIAMVAPEEEPAVESPAVESPAVESPAVESPAVESPAVESPAVESPAVESPEPTQQPSGIAAIISQLFSNFVNRLFGSISRLFGN